MEDEQKTKGLNLKRRKRADGSLVPYWIAPESAVKAGYPTKTVNLSGLDDLAVEQRCHRLNAELAMWRSGRGVERAIYDGTFSSLFNIYETDEDSSFQSLEASSRVPYESYLGRLKAHIGHLRIDHQTGLDLKRWHKTWRAPDEVGGPEKLGAAHMALAVLKAALKFGASARLAGCAQFREAVLATTLPGPRPRKHAPAAAQIVAVREAAHKIGRPSLALAYAIQFETSLRQWDVIGKWHPMGAGFTSSVLGYGEKWAGLEWSNIDDDLILAVTPTKTLQRTGAKVECDLKLCPMVLEEIERVPVEQRVGPVIVSETSGLPWRAQNYRHAWRKIAKAVDLPAGMWNRDLRAGALTEARKGGAAMEDASRMAGHSSVRTTAKVYDRDVLEASRRAQIRRTNFRNGKG